MDYKCVIFDFDGTLADTQKEIIEVYNSLAKKYKCKPIEYSQVEYLKSIPLTQAISELHIPFIQIGNMITKGQKRLREKMKDIHPYNNNIASDLKRLKTCVYSIGIVSSNSKKNIKDFAEKYNLDSLDFIASSTLFSKEDKIKKILRKNKLQPNEVLYVGDEIRDIHACSKLGIKIVCVTWGYNDRELIEKANPDYIIDDFEEIFEIL